VSISADAVLLGNLALSCYTGLYVGVHKCAVQALFAGSLASCSVTSLRSFVHHIDIFRLFLHNTDTAWMLSKTGDIKQVSSLWTQKTLVDHARRGLGTARGCSVRSLTWTHYHSIRHCWSLMRRYRIVTPFGRLCQPANLLKARAPCLTAALRPGPQFSMKPSCKPMIASRCSVVTLHQPRPLHAAQHPLPTEDAPAGRVHAWGLLVLLPRTRDRGCTRHLWRQRGCRTRQLWQLTPYTRPLRRRAHFRAVHICRVLCCASARRCCCGGRLTAPRRCFP